MNKKLFSLLKINDLKEMKSYVSVKMPRENNLQIALNYILLNQDDLEGFHKVLVSLLREDLPKLIEKLIMKKYENTNKEEILKLYSNIIIAGNGYYSIEDWREEDIFNALVDEISDEQSYSVIRNFLLSKINILLNTDNHSKVSIEENIKQLNNQISEAQKIIEDCKNKIIELQECWR